MKIKLKNLSNFPQKFLDSDPESDIENDSGTDSEIEDDEFTPIDCSEYVTDKNIDPETDTEQEEPQLSCDADCTLKKFYYDNQWYWYCPTHFNISDDGKTIGYISVTDKVIWCQ